MQWRYNISYNLRQNYLQLFTALKLIHMNYNQLFIYWKNHALKKGIYIYLANIKDTKLLPFIE